MTVQNNKHSNMVRMLNLQPRLIGLDGIALSTGESILFKKDRLVREPDGLCYDSSTHTLYNIEYKCTHTQNNKRHAKQQLNSCENYLKNIFPDWNIVNLYVYQNYQVEII